MSNFAKSISVLFIFAVIGLLLFAVVYYPVRYVYGRLHRVR